MPGKIVPPCNFAQFLLIVLNSSHFPWHSNTGSGRTLLSPNCLIFQGFELAVIVAAECTTPGVKTQPAGNTCEGQNRRRGGNFAKLGQKIHFLGSWRQNSGRDGARVFRALRSQAAASHLPGRSHPNPLLHIVKLALQHIDLQYFAQILYVLPCQLSWVPKKGVSVVADSFI